MCPIFKINKANVMTLVGKWYGKGIKNVSNFKQDKYILNT